jgi:hypothetical protein
MLLMVDAALTQILYLTIAVCSIFAALHYALALLEVLCDYLGGLYWWWTFRRFASEVVKRLVVLLILVKVAEWSAHLGHLW